MPPSPPGNAVHPVLLIDDDPDFCMLLRDYLEGHGFRLDFAHSGESGLEASRVGEWELILLDMFLPGISGIEVLAALRRESPVPVVILSAHGEEADRIVTLEMGADDYVPKAFSPRELLARIRAVLRRQGPSDPQDGGERLFLRGLRMNGRTMESSLNGVPLDLTALEFRLLYALAREAGRVFSREELLNLIAERDFNKFDRSVDVHISSLRRKLADDSRCPAYLKTLRGIGYTFLK